MGFRMLARKIGTRVLPTPTATLADVPGPYAFPGVGTLPHYLPLIGKYDPTRIYKSSLMKYKEFGPILKETLFGETIVYLYDPNDMEIIIRNKGDSWPKRVTHLVLEHVRTNELKKLHHNGGIFMVNGELWANIRQSFQKSMGFDVIGKFIPKADELATEIVSKINEESMKYHVNTDLLNVIFSYTSDYMGMTLFGETWNSIDNYLDPNSISSQLIRASTELNHATGPTDHGARMWRFFATPLYKQILECARIMDDVVVKRLDSRLEGNKFVAKDGDNLLDTWIRSGNSDYRQMATFLADSILAGIDTMAYTMSFAIYHLSVNPECQETLYKELCKIDPEMRNPMTEEMLAEVSYLKKCLKEALRLNPLALGIGRTLTEDTLLGGYLIPEGSNLVTMNQVASRLPEYVELPDAFIPERYNNDGKFKKLHPFVSMPFSHGPRSCIGRRLAEQSMYIFLFRLFRRYHVEWIGQKPLDCVTSLINKPDAPLLFKFTPRNH